MQVILVDDDPAVRQALGKALDLAGYQVAESPNLR